MSNRRTEGIDGREAVGGGRQGARRPGGGYTEMIKAMDVVTRSTTGYGIGVGGFVGGMSRNSRGR